MTTCSTNCLFYANDGVITIDTNEYNCFPPGPLPLTTELALSQDDNYGIIVGFAFIGTTIYSTEFRVELIGGANVSSNSQIIITNTAPGLSVIPDPKNFSNPSSPVAIIATLNNGLRSDTGVLFPSNTYIPGDNYNITLIDCNEQITSVKNIITRKSNVFIDSDLISTTSQNYQFTSLITGLTIPRIRVSAQTTINGSDIGDAVFTIYDEFTYYDRHTIPDNTCQNRTSDNIKTTIFRECCPYMVNVVKGEGNTLWEKIQYLFNQGSTNNPNVYVFYQNMMLYGMAKYILSRLLYGKFNINYLLGKYNERFLNKLRESRFCRFIEYFEQNDYNKYFLYKN